MYPNVNAFKAKLILINIRYKAIIEGFETIPDSIVKGAGGTPGIGGEYHLFIHKEFNDIHPDFQCFVHDIFLHFPLLPNYYFDHY